LFTRAQDQANKKKFTHQIIMGHTALVSQGLASSLEYERGRVSTILESCSSTEDKRSTKSEWSFRGLGLKCRNALNNQSLKQ
jgi:hypothetical protein